MDEVSTTENLCAEAGRNRGLWIGMFPEASADLERAWENLISQNSDSLAEHKSLRELHVTIFHLGKTHTTISVERTVAAVQMAASTVIGPQLIGVEGYLRLPRHAALAVVPDEIVRIRGVVSSCLRDRGVRPDDRFAGLPHITIGATHFDFDDVVCPGVKSFVGTFRGLTIVCGEASMTVPFKAVF